jgi:secondary thiamine-phosphate synthase enzyme
MARNAPLTEPTSWPWSFAHELLRLPTGEGRQFVDVTDRVIDSVRRSGVSHGLVNVQTLHTTCAVVVNENEPLLLEDLEQALERWAPADRVYRHDDLRIRTVNLTPGERENGHAHAQALPLASAVTLAVVGGTIQLGRWQRIFMVELDGPRPRALGVTAMGLSGHRSGARSMLRPVKSSATRADQ